MLDQWEDWVTVNAYTNFFRISMDRFSTGLEEKVIRFTTPLSYSYDAYDVVIVRVDAEESRVLPNPDKIYNPYPEGSKPDPANCYSCGKLTDELISQGFEDIYNTASADLPFLWPFATASTTDTNFSAYTNIVASGNLNEDWGYINYDAVGDWSWDGTKFAQCQLSGAQPAYIMNAQCNTSVCGLTVPTNQWPSTEYYAVNIVFTGYNGGVDARITLIRDTTTQWNLFTDIGSFYEGAGCDINVGISPIVSGGDHLISISVGNLGAIDGRATGELNIGPVSGVWTNITIDTYSYWELVYNGDPGLDQTQAKLWTTLTATVTGSEGESQQISVTGFNQRGVNNQFGYASLGNSNTTFNSPTFLYGDSTDDAISIASISFTQSPITDSFAIAKEFQRNFTTLEPCPE